MRARSRSTSSPPPPRRRRRAGCLPAPGTRPAAPRPPPPPPGTRPGRRLWPPTSGDHVGGAERPPLRQRRQLGRGELHIHLRAGGVRGDPPVPPLRVIRSSTARAPAISLTPGAQSGDQQPRQMAAPTRRQPPPQPRFDNRLHLDDRHAEEQRHRLFGSVIFQPCAVRSRATHVGGHAFAVDQHAVAVEDHQFNGVPASRSSTGNRDNPFQVVKAGRCRLGMAAQPRRHAPAPRFASPAQRGDEGGTSSFGTAARK